jgi:hypothetical protein
MLDRFLYNFFGWIDSLFEKLEYVTTFDIGQKNKKNKINDTQNNINKKN